MKGIIPIVAGVLVMAALAVSFGIDLCNTADSGAVDLRNRITGVRLMEHGIDPYHYKWQEGDPEEYIDLRNNPNLPVSKTTSTPALLLLHLPFAAMPYRVTQYLWLVVQWLLLLGTGCLWWRACETPRGRWLVTLFIMAFSYTEAWRWQAERGQAYVLFAFLLAYWLTTTRDSKQNFLAGFVAGFLVALRPPAILLLPFLALHRRGQWIGATTGLITGFGLPMFLKPLIWADYFSAMQTFSHLYRNSLNPAGSPMNYPEIIEGIPLKLLGTLMPFHAGDFSVHGLLRYLKWEPVPGLPLLLAVGILFVLWLWLSRAQKIDRLLTGMAAWFFLGDLFLPALRFSYHDVFILNVVFAGIVATRKLSPTTWLCLLALPIGWSIYLYFPTEKWWINLPAFLFTLGAILSLLPRRSGRALTSEESFWKSCVTPSPRS